MLLKTAASDLIAAQDVQVGDEGKKQNLPTSPSEFLKLTPFLYILYNTHNAAE